MWQPSVWLEELLGPLIVHKTFWWVPKEISHPGKLSTCYLPQISNPDDWDVKTTMGSPTRFFPCPYFGCKCKRDRSCLSALLSTWTWAVEDCICTASKQACFALSEFLLFAHASCFWFRKGNLGVIQGSNGQVASTSVFFISFPKLSLMLALQVPLETWRTRGLSPLSACCCSYQIGA